MSDAWFTVALAFGGCAAGACIGWVVGRVYRGRPLNVLFAIVLVFAGACYVVWVAPTDGRAWMVPLGLGAAFGAMTAVKYSSGLIPGMDKPLPAAVTEPAVSDLETSPNTAGDD